MDISASSKLDNKLDGALTFVPNAKRVDLTKNIHSALAI